MRYQLSFSLENEYFPLDYRRIILSFIKKALSEYDETTYEKYYHAKDPTKKPFTFSVYFYSSEFQKDKILVHKKSLEVSFSIADYSLAIMLYNSINHQRYKEFPIANNKMILNNIMMLPETQITTEQIKIKFLSPLIVRERVNEKDWYYSYCDGEKFEEILKINVKEQLETTNIPKETVDTLKLEPINPKKTVVKFYEKQMEASLGTYLLSGDKTLLNFLYQCGLGSRHSSGFGMFSIIK